jgi:5-methylcytosine-specific restriction protein B
VSRISIINLLKELKINQSDLINYAKSINIDFKNTSISKEDADKIRLHFKGETMSENKINEKRAKDLNVIYYGSAGTGKTREAMEDVKQLTGEEHDTAKKDYQEEIVRIEKDENISKAEQRKKIKEIKSQNNYQAYPLVEFTTFHPSYQYQEFIEGINIKEQDGNISYEVKDGIFKKIAKRALANRDKNYVLIIDEINRGNISAIFGELFTLLEESKRDGNKEALSIALPYSQEKFSVPNNLYVIGTMNTTDKSISLLDVALRRRFKFIEVVPDYEAIPKFQDLDLVKMLQAINNRLIALKGEEFQIGHSYFLKAEGIGDLQEIFKYKIIPLLKEYFHNDWEVICAVLGQDHNSENNPLLETLVEQKDLFKSSADKFKAQKNKKMIFKLKDDFSLRDLTSIYE